MNTAQTKIPTDTWVNATWEEYLSAIEAPSHPKSKSYFYKNQLRIEMTPIGSDHSCDHTIVIAAVSLFTAIKQIAVTGRDNCSYRKMGFAEVQPDVSYYVGENSEVIPWGTGIIDLDVYPPPDLVIEVANTSLVDDQGAKRLLYEDLGVKEYWILNVKDVRVLAFAIANQGSYRIAESQVLPGLAISLLQETLQRSRQTNQSQVLAWLMAEFQRS